MTTKKPTGKSPQKPPASVKKKSPVRRASARASNKPTQALSPTTQPADPAGYSGRGLMFISQRSSAGVTVNEDTALTQTTVWACQRVISESLAGVPWRTGKLTKSWSVDPVDHDVNDWILNYASNPETKAFVFRDTLVQWALGWGNGYAEIERDYAGNAVALWQIHPRRVRPVRADNGELYYEVTNDKRKPDYVPQRDMFHLMGPSPDGLVGWSVIQMHARTIGLAIAQEESAATFNANDSTPGGILSHPKTLSDMARKNLEESWNRRHKGPNNRRTIAILEEDMKWTQTGVSPDDAKLVEQMQLTPAMICRIFGVPPHKVAASVPNASNMYSNVEQNELAFVRDTLRPWSERLESEADLKLFGRNNQARLVTHIDLRERERGDTASQTQHVERMIFTGVYSVNEGRQYLGLSGIGPEGERRYIQSAMIPLEDAGKATSNPSQPDQTPSDSQPPTDNTLSTVQAKAMAVLVDACRRMLKRENDAHNLDGEALSAWMLKHLDYCREILIPAASVLSACVTSRELAADLAVSLFLNAHLENREGTPESKAMQLREYIFAASAAKVAA